MTCSLKSQRGGSTKNDTAVRSRDDSCTGRRKGQEILRPLGFEDVTSVVISGEEMSRYMGIDGIEAEHVTLELLEWH